MAAKGTSYVNSHRSPRGFMYVLSSAACEWFFIFLLFVDGTLSYLLTKFARYCDLQTHCLLCSRLDHFFENEKPHFYKNLLCNNHKVEISSLVYCNVHDKLADVRDMCEECVMSFFTQNKSSPLFIGRSGLDFERGGFSSPFLNNNFIPGSVNTRYCSCCNMPWRPKSNAHRLLQIAPIGYGARANVKPPLPRTPGRSRFSRRDSMKKMRDKFAEPSKPRNPLPHVGYSELKFTSDSDSDFQFSDDDRKSEFNKDLVAGRSAKNVPKTPQTQQASSGHEPSLLDQSVQLHGSEPRDAKYSAWNSLRELIWDNPMPELISLNDVPLSPNVEEGHVGVGISADTPLGTLSRESSGFALSELSLLDVIPPSDVVTIPSPENLVDANGINDIGHTSISGNAEFTECTSPTSDQVLKTVHVLHSNAPPIANGTETSNVSESVGGIKELAFEVSSVHLKQPPLEPKGVHEDAKLSPHEVSSAIGIDGMHIDSEELRRTESSTKELAFEVSSVHLKQPPPPLDTIVVQEDAKLSPNVSSAIGIDGTKTDDEELGRTESSNSKEIPSPRKSTSLDRKESGYESIDGSSTISEIEGESVVERLRRQIEHDKRCMSALYKELEEERNAASDAANEAMAMITRLQEEKAALHMEALQYLRMMEEQAEYDMDALEKANDLLAEKDKEIQDLEAELEFYKNIIEDSMVMDDETYNFNGNFMENNGDVPPNNSMVIEGSDETIIHNNDFHCVENNAHVPSNSTVVDGSDKTPNVKTASNVEESKNQHDETYSLNGDQSMMVDKNDWDCVENNAYVPSNSTIVDEREKTTNVKTSSNIQDSTNLHDEAYNLNGDQSMMVDKNDLHCVENNANVHSDSTIVEGSDKTTNVKASLDSNGS
ncbi:myosin-binding protein 1-like [Cornus florida]|uniref:myosin-binding protein 1-like n=1 Tax=Cornus florida TaxID=4283 RepID=UPI002897E1D6|nr:myosin-binding protein 1-like [Cornus florida]